jgi:hypothetical protein
MMTTKQQAPPSTALAVVEATGYPVLRDDAGDAILAMRENLGGTEISPFDLDVVSVPAGGGTSWLVPGLAGEEDAKAIEGILVHHQPVRSFWRTAFDESGGGTPPDCSSRDGRVGLGDPGGECARCPMNAWGSGGKGNGRAKACQERHLLFVIRQGEFMPLLVNVPPSSLGAVKKLLLRLASKGVPYWSVILALGLSRDKNADGIAYSKVSPTLVGTLPPADLQWLARYRDAIVPSLARVKVEEVFEAGGE